MSDMEEEKGRLDRYLDAQATIDDYIEFLRQRSYKLVAEKAALERENARLRKEIAEARSWLEQAAEEMDLECGENTTSEGIRHHLAKWQRKEASDDNRE